MDITRSETRQEVAPPSWVIAQRQQDVPDVVRRAIEGHPEASVDDLVEQLRQRNVPVSGIFVAREKLRHLAQRRAANAGRPSGGGDAPKLS